jgi:predicted anti-sigma-YlaC factor YlaD
MQAAVRERECARARQALSLTLDGEAAPVEIYRLALHLGQCESCRRFTAQVGAITRRLRSMRYDCTTQAVSTPGYAERSSRSAPSSP